MEAGKSKEPVDRMNDGKGVPIMKKILCILLCICMLIPLAACGGERGKQHDDKEQDLGNNVGSDKGQNAGDGNGITDKNWDDAAVVLYERYETLRVTVAKNEDGKQAIVKVDDQNKQDYFFATDEQGNCYRVEYSSLEEGVVKQGATLYLTYYGEWLKEIENIEEDHGFVPRYDLGGYIWSAKAWQLKDIACEKASEAFELPACSLKLMKCYYSKSGEYEFDFDMYLAGIKAARVSLGLNTEGDIVETDLGYDEEFLKYIGTDIEKAIPAAKAKIQAKCGTEDPHLYFQIDKDDGYVYLCAETIDNLDKDDPRYGKVGCVNHIHHMYREKLGKA